MTNRELAATILMLGAESKDLKGKEAKELLTQVEEEITKHIKDQLKNGVLHSVSDLFINTEYLMELHPELNKEEAESLKEYAASRTIEYKECYGDGSIIYPKWKKENNR